MAIGGAKRGRIHGVCDTFALHVYNLTTNTINTRSGVGVRFLLCFIVVMFLLSVAWMTTTLLSTSPLASTSSEARDLVTFFPPEEPSLRPPSPGRTAAPTPVPEPYYNTSSESIVVGNNSLSMRYVTHRTCVPPTTTTTPATRTATQYDDAHLPTFFPVEPIDQHEFLDWTSRHLGCGRPPTQRTGSQDESSPSFATLLTNDARDNHWSTCLGALLRDHSGSFQLELPTRHGEWVAKVQLLQKKELLLKKSVTADDYYFIIVLEHHYKPVAPYAPNRRSTVIVANSTDRSHYSFWDAYIRNVVGPDEIRGNVLLCGANREIVMSEINVTRLVGKGPRVEPTTVCNGRAFLLPLGFTFAGSDPESGLVDYYVAPLPLRMAVPPAAGSTTNSGDQQLEYDPYNATFLFEQSISKSVLQVNLVHEYEGFWATNEHMDTALSHSGKAIVAWDRAEGIAVTSSLCRSGSSQKHLKASASAACAPPLIPNQPTEAASLRVHKTRFLYRRMPQGLSYAPLVHKKQPPLAYLPIKGANEFGPVQAHSLLLLSQQIGQEVSPGVEDVALSATDVCIPQTPAAPVSAAVGFDPRTSCIASITARRHKAASLPGEGSSSVSTRGRAVNVLFTGDSQTRSLFFHWAAVVDNRAVDLRKVFNVTMEHNTVEPNEMTWKTTFLWDAYLHRLAAWDDAQCRAVAAEYSVIVFGFGSWPASYGQYSFSDIVRRADAFAAVAKRLRAFGVTVVYAGSPAWPKHRKANPKFRITNTRLSIYNRIAFHALTSGVDKSSTAGGGAAPFHVLPFFDLSVTMASMKRSDGMHYDGSIVTFAVVEVLALEVLQLCD